MALSQCLFNTLAKTTTQLLRRGLGVGHDKNLIDAKGMAWVGIGGVGSGVGGLSVYLDGGIQDAITFRAIRVAMSLKALSAS